MKFIAIQPSSHEELLWDQYVSQEPRATGYHLIGWRRIVEETFGHTTMYFSAMDDRGRFAGRITIGVVIQQDVRKIPRLITLRELWGYSRK